MYQLICSLHQNDVTVDDSAFKAFLVTGGQTIQKVIGQALFFEAGREASVFFKLFFEAGR